MSFEFFLSLSVVTVAEKHMQEDVEIEEIPRPCSPDSADSPRGMLRAVSDKGDKRKTTGMQDGWRATHLAKFSGCMHISFNAIKDGLVVMKKDALIASAAASKRGRWEKGVAGSLRRNEISQRMAARTRYGHGGMCVIDTTSEVVS